MNRSHRGRARGGEECGVFGCVFGCEKGKMTERRELFGGVVGFKESLGFLARNPC